MALRLTENPPPAPPREDREAAYRARRASLESRLGAAGGTAARELPALFAGVAREALEGLAAEPREPVLLNYAGVGLYELGVREAAAASARRCGWTPTSPTPATTSSRRSAAARRRRCRRPSSPSCPGSSARRATSPPAPSPPPA